MGGFNAALTMNGDTKPLQARVEVNDGRLSIRSADYEIGEWQLKELDLKRTPAGFTMEVEGEELMLKIQDPLAFELAIGGVNRRKVAKPRSQWTTQTWNKAMAMLDKGLARAKDRAGSLLPEWVFTRKVAAAAGVALVILVVFPGIVSTLLLFGGFAVVVFGAVLYTDRGLAVRLLPGRMTGTHVLIAGVALVVVGFLAAVVFT